jgi:hypothetical protein
MEKIKLDLSLHCIQTEIKKHYNRALALYFRDETGRAELERIIDLTGQALQTLDFNSLRSRHASLAGYSDAEVLLCRQGGRLSLVVDGVPVEL